MVETTRSCVQYYVAHLGVLRFFISDGLAGDLQVFNRCSKLVTVWAVFRQNGYGELLRTMLPECCIGKRLRLRFVCRR